MVRGAAARHSEAMNSDSSPKILTRSNDDRMLGGVAGGLAEYFGIDPVIARVGFVIATLMSGAGALAYLALLVLVPSADEARHDGGSPLPV
jgi:phage shock protein C